MRVASEALDALDRARQVYGEGVYQCYVHRMNGSPLEIGWWYDPSLLGPIRYAISVRGPIATVRKLAKGELYPFLPFRFPREGFDGLSFNASVVTAGVREAVGPVDEGFPLGWEDIDYSLRCHEQQMSYFSVPGSGRVPCADRGPQERRSTGVALVRAPRREMAEGADGSDVPMGPKERVAR